MESNAQDKIIWVDLEMTGLDVNKERIMEIAVVVTNGDLSNPIEGPNIYIHQSDELLASMDEWCVKTHGESGLTEKCRQSTVDEKQAEDAVLEFVQKHTKKGECPLAGNSIYMDKIFLMKFMPRLCEHLHYRLIDVTTLKELTKRWRPDVLESAPTKKWTHRALDDIRESIQELQHYKSKLF